MLVFLFKHWGVITRIFGVLVSIAAFFIMVFEWAAEESDKYLFKFLTLFEGSGGVVEKVGEMQANSTYSLDE